MAGIKVKCSLKALSSLKKNNHKVGVLRYKSEYVSINLQQHKITYRFNDDKHIGIQGFSKSLKDPRSKSVLEHSEP